MHKPSPCRPGDTVAIVAPASPFRADNLTQGIAWLESLGYRVRHRPDIHDEWRYLAGSDERRAQELLDALNDPDVSAVICARGGYGGTRLLPALARAPRPQRPVLFVGFSDVTTLHLFLQQSWHWVTVHGPMVGTAWAGAGLEQASRDSLLHVLQSPTPARPIHGTETVRGGVSEGRMTGGNLSLIAHSVGTPWQADFKDAIVFLEDIGEAPYRIDRMVTQLLHAGVFEGVRGIVLGDWTDCAPPAKADFTTLEVLRERLEPLGVPLAAGFPIGHEERNLSVPLGVRARLDADARVLTFLEAATETKNAGVSAPAPSI